MKKDIIVLLAAALALGLVIGWFAHGGLTVRTPVTNKFGAVIGYQSSLGSQLTFNAFNSLVTDVTSVRAPLSAVVVTTTASISFPVVGSSTLQTTTTAGGIAALQGDLVFISPATSTAGIVYQAGVATASTTNATFYINALWATSTVVTPTATTFNITVLPAATFKAPAALLSSTSSVTN